jgi:tetratricopeptide (TPR) repeat protein
MTVDEQVGRLLAAWPHKRSETLIMIVSDHGEGLGENGEATHGHLLHQATLRVPFLLVPPDGVQVPDNPNPALLVDVYPTVRAILRLPPDRTRDGRSLLDPPPATWTAWSETLYPYYQFQYSHLQAWFQDDLKLVDGGSKQRLVQFRVDPEEANDLASEDPDSVRLLDQALRYFRSKRAAASADSLEVEVNAAVPYMGGRPSVFPVEPSEERNRSLPRIWDKWSVVSDLDAARRSLAKRPPEPWNAAPLLAQHVAEKSTNPAIGFWLARSLQLWGRSPQISLTERLLKLEEAYDLFLLHEQTFGDLRSGDARIRTIWDRYQATEDLKVAHLLLKEGELLRAKGIDRPLVRALSALACEAIGDPKGAIEHLEHAIRLDPEDSRYGDDLKRLQREAGSGK